LTIAVDSTSQRPCSGHRRYAVNQRGRIPILPGAHPDSALGEDDTWGILQGLTEAELNDELQRRWLLWRDELIRAGTDRPGALADALLERQVAWETTPHPALAGKTPVEAVQAERREREERKRPRPKKARRGRKKGGGKGRKR